MKEIQPRFGIFDDLPLFYVHSSPNLSNPLMCYSFYGLLMDLIKCEDSVIGRSQCMIGSICDDISFTRCLQSNHYLALGVTLSNFKFSMLLCSGSRYHYELESKDEYVIACKAEIYIEGCFCSSMGDCVACNLCIQLEKSIWICTDH